MNFHKYTLLQEIPFEKKITYDEDTVVPSVRDHL